MLADSAPCQGSTENSPPLQWREKPRNKIASDRDAGAQAPGRREPPTTTSERPNYCPAAAIVDIVIGRLNSSTNCVPEGMTAERLCTNQCVVAALAPIAPPISTPGPPPIKPPI